MGCRGVLGPAQPPAKTAGFRRPAASLPAPHDRAEAAKVALGRTLFFDPRLSGSGVTSCASCHDPSRGWQDGRPTAIGEHGARLPRRTPTVADVAWVEPLFWDGRADTLEDQARIPLTAAAEMNLPGPRAVARLSRIGGYVRRFAAAYPNQPITVGAIAGAIAAYERTIVSGPAPFDRWVGGDAAAIPRAARRGFAVFTGKGRCAGCHSGWRFTDDGFRDTGLASEDPGRGAVVPGIPSLRYAFKTPTLRNVAERAPYMHDGSLPTLEAVIEHYDNGFARRPSLAAEMRPLHLTPYEKADLVAFLGALTSDDDVVVTPDLPQ